MTGAGPRRSGLAGDTWVALVAALAALAVAPVALPAILADLPTSLAGALWVLGAAAAGLVAGCALAVPLSRRLSSVRTLWWGAIALAVTGVLCAAAGTAAELIAARAAEGVAAGVVTAAGVTVLSGSHRRRWTLRVGLVALVAAGGVLGVVAGAFAVTAPGWRAVFALAAVAAAVPALTMSPRSRRTTAIPATGAGAALAGAVLLLALPLQAAAGAAYAAIDTRGEVAQYPPPGRLIDVGGHRLHIRCEGFGSPTVLLEADAGAWSLDWSAVQQDISIHSRVCAYDRAGLGWSDAATRPRTAAVDVDEVRTLLRNEGERGPFIAVGNGFGGVVVRLWAALHPGEVSGMVLVDSTDPEFYAGADDIVAAGNLVAAESLFALWSPIGLELVALQVGGDGYAAGYPPAVTDQLIATAHRTGLCAARRDEALDAAESAAELAAAEHGLGSIPLAVLRHGRAGLFSGPRAAEEESDWEAMQGRLAHLSSAGRLQVAPQAGHVIMLDQPQLVVDAIDGVVDAVRARIPAP